MSEFTKHTEPEHGLHTINDAFVHSFNKSCDGYNEMCRSSQSAENLTEDTGERLTIYVVHLYCIVLQNSKQPKCFLGIKRIPILVKESCSPSFPHISKAINGSEDTGGRAVNALLFPFFIHYLKMVLEMRINSFSWMLPLHSNQY